jgi:hypothetical protein
MMTRHECQALELDRDLVRRSQAEGGRVFSRYTLASGTVVYLITEGATTTIMLSGEY